MRVAIVGCGFIADQYAQGIQQEEDLELVAAADLVSERAVALTNVYGGTPHADVESLLEESDAELVINLTIHGAHHEVTRAGLDAGKHVYSEKPLALRAADAQELVALANERGVRLGCAPINLMADAQQVAWRYLRERRLGTVRMIYADCNLGRVAEWNVNPEPFLHIGPLLDGAVYPLTVLTGYLGPATRVHSAHHSQLLTEHEIDGRRVTVDTPDHTVAILEFASGPRCRLTASMYVPYQTKHFNSIELHGDAGSLYLANCGDLSSTSDEPQVEFARVGKEYLPVPMPRRPEPLTYASAVVEMAGAIREGRRHYAGGDQAAHIVEVIEAINASAEAGEPVAVESQFTLPEPREWAQRVWPVGPVTRLMPEMPAIGFGCSRYRGDGVYVDLEGPIEDALDMGYRLLDSAELYGNERQIGAILQRPGSPPRDELFIVGKVWNTNHAYDHVIDACEKTLRELQLNYLDLYLIHWPQAFAYQGPLENLRALSHDAADALTFPADGAGTLLTADVPLIETWRAMEALQRRELVRAIGVSNFEITHLEDILAEADVMPAVNQIEHHPYRQQNELVAFCREHGIQMMAYSPLSAEGLLEDTTLQALADAHGVSVAQIVLRWNVQRGIVPIPSSTTPTHIVANLDIFAFELSGEDMRTIATLDTRSC